MKTRIHSSLLLLALCLCAFGTTAAAAPRVSSVLILPNGAEDVDLLLSNAADALRQLNIAITEFDDATLAGFEFESALACLTDEKSEDCSDSFKMVPAEWILLLQIRRTSEDPDSDQRVIAKLYSALTADLVQVEQRVCQRCSSSERMAAVIRELVTDMAEKQLAEKARDTFLDVQSAPTGAVLTIDGTDVGPTGQSYRVTPGEHEIVLRHKGYRMASQKVVVAANEHKAITVSLDPKPAPNRWQRRLGYGAMGFGLGAMALGGYYVAVDDGDRKAGEPFASSRNDSATAGTVLLGTGLAFAIAGAVAVFTASSEDDDALTVSATPHANGFALGLGGRF
jgi:hypothetical protein